MHSSDTPLKRHVLRVLRSAGLLLIWPKNEVYPQPRNEEEGRLPLRWQEAL